MISEDDDDRSEHAESYITLRDSRDHHSIHQIFCRIHFIIIRRSEVDEPTSAKEQRKDVEKRASRHVDERRQSDIDASVSKQVR